MKDKHIISFLEIFVQNNYIERLKIANLNVQQ